MEYTKDYTIGDYICKQDIKDFIEAHKDSTIDELYKCILECAEKLKTYQETQNKCKSDIAYWSYIQLERAERAYKLYCEDRILQMLEATGSETLKQADKNTHRYHKIMLNQKRLVKDLLKYKPAGYKRMIQCLKEVVDTEGDN